MSKASILKKIRILRLIIIYPCLISLFALMSFPLAASAANEVEIGWGAASGPVAGYYVYYGTSSGNYTTTLNAGNSTSLTIEDLGSQTYYIAVAAYDGNDNTGPLSSELVIDSLSASAGSGGSISPSGSLFVVQGGSQAYTVTPSSGYVISGVQVNGASVGALSSYTFSDIAASDTISATFSAETSSGTTSSSFTISASAGSGGSISPSGSVSVASGASQTFAITPASGYNLGNVTVDGASVGALSTYTFSDVTANHTISATFVTGASGQSGSYSITATAGANGTISPSGAVAVTAGGNQTFGITPAAGYQVSSVLVDGTSVGAVTSYTFYSVSATHTISASFVTRTPPPVVDAGPNQTVVGGTEVTLSNANTTDIGGPGIASYHWIQTGGPTVAQSGAYWITSNFQAPSSEGPLTFQLLVTDKNGVTATSTCIVNVSSWYTTAPTANAGQCQTVDPGAAVELNGTASAGPSDESSDVIKTYLWQQLDGPAVTLSNPTSPTPTFTAPTVANGYGSMCFMLTVTDSLGFQATDFCYVNVDSSGSASSAPTAVTGAEQAVNSGSVVTLSGSGSTAPSGIAAYRWRQTGGTPVTLSNPTSAKPTFTVAKYSGTYGDILTFTLTVTDNNGLRSKATELVTVN